MTYIIISGVLIVIGLVWLAWFLGGPVRYRSRVDDDKLNAFFTELLSSVYKTGFLVFVAPDKQQLVQFRRYQTEDTPGLRFDFPLRPGFEHYYQSLKQVLSARGIDYQTTTDRDSINYITVNLEQDCPKATNLARLVLLEVLKLKPEDQVEILFGK